MNILLFFKWPRVLDSFFMCVSVLVYMCTHTDRHEGMSLQVELFILCLYHCKLSGFSDSTLLY